jgi:hypothetical protein
VPRGVVEKGVQTLQETGPARPLSTFNPKRSTKSSIANAGSERSSTNSYEGRWLVLRDLLAVPEEAG